MIRSALCWFLVLCLAVTVVQAAKLPDWAKPLAENPPSLAESVDYDSRVLLRETRLSLAADGRVRVRRYIARQALNEMGSEIGLGSFSFDEQDELVHSKAWHVVPGGRAKRSRGGVLDLSASDVFLSDRMTRHLYVDDIETGSLVFYDFEALEFKEQLAHYEWFYSDVPLLKARVVVELPDGWAVQYDWLRQPGPEPRREGNHWVWELNDVPAMDVEEELADSGDARAPILVMSFEPESAPDPEPGNDTVAAAFGDWTEVALWYQQVAEGRSATTPEIAELAQGLGTPSDAFLEQVQALGSYVRDRIRYIANDIGQGGYQPRTAASVAKNLFGDCKDKTTLLQSMLSADEFESYPILVHATQPFTVSRQIPSLYAFNHAVLGVAIPDDVEVALSGLIDVPQLGRLLVIDATDEYASIGMLSGALAGKMALIVAGEVSSLVELPDEPAAHRIDRRLKAQVHPDGGLTATLTESCTGDPASRQRVEYRDSIQDYRQRLTQSASDIWPGATVQNLEVTDEDEELAFVWTATVEVPAPNAEAPGDFLRLFPRAMSGLGTVSLRRRELPVVYDRMLTMTYESVVSGLPMTARAPLGKETSGEGWRVVATTHKDGDTVTGRWEVRLQRKRFEPEQFDELKAFWREARRTSSVVLSTGGGD